MDGSSSGMSSTEPQSGKLHHTRLQLLCHQPDEDWTGVTDRAARKKLQNRLNQRAQRARKSRREEEQAALRKAAADRRDHRKPILILPRPEKTSKWVQISRSTTLPMAVAMMTSFHAMAYERYHNANPCLDHLLTLSKLNILRAILDNSKILGLNDQDMEDDALSPFNRPTRDIPKNQDLPMSLLPTLLQRDVPHHPWLDCFPFPRMRENLIKADGSFNDCTLCGDIMDPGMEDAGMLVWGDPWLPQNWEVSEAFLRKWFWVVRGSPELLESTNYWRMRRGLKRVNLKRLSQGS